MIMARKDDLAGCVNGHRQSALQRPSPRYPGPIWFPRLQNAKNARPGCRPQPGRSIVRPCYSWRRLTLEPPPTDDGLWSGHMKIGRG